MKPRIAYRKARVAKTAGVRGEIGPFAIVAFHRGYVPHQEPEVERRTILPVRLEPGAVSGTSDAQVMNSERLLL